MRREHIVVMGYIAKPGSVIEFFIKLNPYVLFTRRSIAVGDELGCFYCDFWIIRQDALNLPVCFACKDESFL
jgi:hypothetical protein